MNKEQRDTITVRIVSTAFVVAALAVFRPFGLGEWHSRAILHLVAMWVIGVGVCMVTDCILRYIARMPSSTSRGVGYILHRNIWFQLINTPLEALAICLYRHFVLSHLVASNRLSWGGYLETLLIIAFCSFAVGLFWRIRFRNRYLETELEEVRMLNEQLLQVQQKASSPRSSATVTLTGSTSETVTLAISHLLYVESVGNYVKVCRLADGKSRVDMLRATSKHIEDELRPYPSIVRCHRAFLVNLRQVERAVSSSGSIQLLVKHCHETIPVSRSNAPQVRAALAANKG